MTTLVFASAYDSKGKHDASGAFVPEALEYARLVKGTYYPIDCRMKNDRRRTQVLEALKQHEDITRLAFFCHGWSFGIQCGFNKDKIQLLFNHLRVGEHLRIALYACSTAENAVKDSDYQNVGPGTEGGFADALRDKMKALKIPGWVDAHKTAGHTTKNPHVVRFGADGSTDYIVTPGSPMWKTWVKALQENMRFRFPDLERAEIVKELSGC